ncbi:unnamed protein product [Closterium sp. Yama58-4]|nr:unnamed protein product [Closterium sp. Yama58-4]
MDAPCRCCPAHIPRPLFPHPPSPFPPPVPPRPSPPPNTQSPRAVRGVAEVPEGALIVRFEFRKLWAAQGDEAPAGESRQAGSNSSAEAGASRGPLVCFALGSLPLPSDHEPQYESLEAAAKAAGGALSPFGGAMGAVTVERGQGLGDGPGAGGGAGAGKGGGGRMVDASAAAAIAAMVGEGTLLLSSSLLSSVLHSSHLSSSFLSSPLLPSARTTFVPSPTPLPPHPFPHTPSPTPLPPHPFPHTPSPTPLPPHPFPTPLPHTPSPTPLPPHPFPHTPSPTPLPPHPFPHTPSPTPLPPHPFPHTPSPHPFPHTPSPTPLPPHPFPHTPSPTPLPPPPSPTPLPPHPFPHTPSPTPLPPHPFPHTPSPTPLPPHPFPHTPSPTPLPPHPFPHTPSPTPLPPHPFPHTPSPTPLPPHPFPTPLPPHPFPTPLPPHPFPHTPSPTPLPPTPLPPHPFPHTPSPTPLPHTPSPTPLPPHPFPHTPSPTPLPPHPFPHTPSPTPLPPHPFPHTPSPTPLPPHPFPHTPSPTPLPHTPPPTHPFPHTPSPTPLPPHPFPHTPSPTPLPPHPFPHTPSPTPLPPHPFPHPLPSPPPHPPPHPSPTPLPPHPSPTPFPHTPPPHPSPTPLPHTLPPHPSPTPLPLPLPPSPFPYDRTPSLELHRLSMHLTCLCFYPPPLAINASPLPHALATAAAAAAVAAAGSSVPRASVYLLVRAGGLPSLTRFDASAVAPATDMAGRGGQLSLELIHPAEVTTFVAVGLDAPPPGAREEHEGESGGQGEGGGDGEGGEGEWAWEWEVRVVQHGCPNGCSGSPCHVMADGAFQFGVYYCFCDRSHGGVDCSIETVSQLGIEQQRWALVGSNVVAVLPAMVSLYLGAYPEWVMFSLNGLCSALYHLCDTDGWCAARYPTLQFADFYSSFLAVLLAFLHAAQVPIWPRFFFFVLASFSTSILAVDRATSGWSIVVLLALGAAALITGWLIRLAALRHSRTSSCSDPHAANAPRKAGGCAGEWGEEASQGGHVDGEDEDASLLSSPCTHGYRRGGEMSTACDSESCGGSSSSGAEWSCGVARTSKARQQASVWKRAFQWWCKQVGEALRMLRALLAAFHLPSLLLGVLAALLAASSFLVEVPVTYWIWHSVWHVCIYSAAFFFMLASPPPSKHGSLPLPPSPSALSPPAKERYSSCSPSHSKDVSQAASGSGNGCSEESWTRGKRAIGCSVGREVEVDEERGLLLIREDS